MKRARHYGLIAVVVIGMIALFISLQSSDRPVQQLETAASDSGDKQETASNNCVQSRPFATAYQVHTEVESKLEKQAIYRSQLDFRMQLRQAPGDGIFGAATDIAITETTVGRDISEPHPLEDVLFLTRSETSEHTVFTEFNDLGLMKQHPMGILSQLLKNISIGDEGKAYRFTYDQLQHEYRYRASNDNRAKMRRDLLASNYPTSLSDKLQPLWKISLDEQCLPKSLQAEEMLPLASAGKAGSVRFIMQAERIADYMDLSSLNYTAQANQNNSWEVATVKTTDFTPQVTSEKEMWDIFRNFKQTKNTAALARAADYLIEHVQPGQLTDTLMEGVLADDEIRDMIFALGLTSHAKAEDYMLDILGNLSAKHNDSADLFKVRLMVAISGNDLVTDKAFNTLASMVNDTGESSNVRRNALINMGSTVRQMQVQGQDISAVSNRLDAEIISHMQDNDSSSAIFSAGNVGLDNLSKEATDSVLAKLQSGNQKERYASARILSRDSRYYDNLIDHLTRESSLLVGTAIVSGLQKDRLSGEQRSRLQEIGNSAPEQLRHEIEKLLGT